MKDSHSYRGRDINVESPRVCETCRVVCSLLSKVLETAEFHHWGEFHPKFSQISIVSDFQATPGHRGEFSWWLGPKTFEICLLGEVTGGLGRFTKLIPCHWNPSLYLQRQ